MSRPRWCCAHSGPYDDHDVKTGASCSCLFVLELALDVPDGPFALQVADDGAGLPLLRVEDGREVVRHCPRCGGRVAPYRKELLEAHARFRAARARYAGLLDARSHDEVEALARACGAAEPLVPRTDDVYALVSWHDPRGHVRVDAEVDEDTRRVVARCRFWPPRALVDAVSAPE